MKGTKVSHRSSVVIAMVLSVACAQAYAQVKMQLVQDGCAVTEDQVRKDAAELGPLLLQGSLDFYRRFTGLYGYHKERECALQGFMKELHLIDPDDVKLTRDNPQGGRHTYQSFPENSPDPTFKGYDLNPWRLISQGSVEDLIKRKSTLVVSHNINQSIEPTDREIFMADFKKRLGKLPFDIRQNEFGELVVFSTGNN
jgi:hypothetical protein